MNVRRKLVAGNWKMNGSRAALAELAADRRRGARGAGRRRRHLPALHPDPVGGRAPAGSPIGGQDCHGDDSGAHTGNVSAPMLKEAGARLVIVGHSERRADQAESDEIVRAKAEAALRHGLQAIVCVGESEAEREPGRRSSGSAQLAGSLPDVDGEGELVVAYEPIWAIGTGRTATPADVAEMHAAIRDALAPASATPAAGSGSSTAARSTPATRPRSSRSTMSTAPSSAAPASPPPSSSRSSRRRRGVEGTGD